MTSHSQTIVFHGHKLELLPQRALWWPAQQRLLVADVHLGKDQVFRRRGIAIPDAPLAHDLMRMQQLLDDYPDSTLTILGDLVHAPPQTNENWAIRFVQWLETAGPQRLQVILGNHDRQMAGLLDAWGIVHHQQLDMDGVMLCHETEAGHEPQIGGHLHPGIRLKADGQQIRLPVFWQQPQTLILPAFGRFTGMADINPEDADHVYPVQSDKVFHLPARQQ